jgi:hypothetical protein
MLNKYIQAFRAEQMRKMQALRPQHNIKHTNVLYTGDAVKVYYIMTDKKEPTTHLYAQGIVIRGNTHRHKNNNDVQSCTSSAMSHIVVGCVMDPENRKHFTVFLNHPNIIVELCSSARRKNGSTVAGRGRSNRVDDFMQMADKRMRKSFKNRAPL